MPRKMSHSRDFCGEDNELQDPIKAVNFLSILVNIMYHIVSQKLTNSLNFKYQCFVSL
jgi:hypothetical protein